MPLFSLYFSNFSSTQKIDYSQFKEQNSKILYMKSLTKAEEDIMQIIWQLERCTVSDLRDYIQQETGGNKPPHSTISTIVRILEEKGFVSFLVKEEKIDKEELSKLLNDSDHKTNDHD